MKRPGKLLHIKALLLQSSSPQPRLCDKEEGCYIGRDVVCNVP